MKRTTVFTLAAVPALAFAQTQQVVKPPIAQYWMSVETAAGMSIPGMGAVGGAMMGMMGGGAAQGGKRMLLQLGSRDGNSAPKAEHDIPAGMEMGPMLPIVTPDKPKPEPREDERYFGEQKPKGRMLVYWGCGENVRAGQPVVIDFAKVADGQMPPNLVSHRVAIPNAPSPARHKTYGDWPNREDQKRVPEKASLRGDHLVKGNYSPEIRFSLGDGHDFMDAVSLASAPKGAGAQSATWNSVSTATGYFATVVGGSGQEEVVFWTSSEVQEMGGQLMSYVPPAEVARLIREKIVMPPSQTECTVPGEVVKKAGGSPMMNFIAYGPEANFVEPPRPKDPKVAWEQVWVAKVRFKSTAMTMLGDASRGERSERRTERGSREEKPADSAAPSSPQDAIIKEGIKGLRGIFGR